MKSFVQQLLEQGLNHASSKMIVEGLDFVAGLSEDDMKEWTALLDIDEKARAYAVWRAARGENSTPNLPPLASGVDPNPKTP